MKVNIHITEACNYHCKHCFAHFPQNGTLVADSWKIVLDNLTGSGMVDGGCHQLCGRRTAPIQRFAEFTGCKKYRVT